MDITLPHSTVTAHVDADVEAARERYEQEVAKRSATPARSRAHRPGAQDPVGGDPWTERTPREPITTRCEVLVIGAGFSGLTLAARLKEAGVQDVRLLEHGGDVGGVWYWNRYPNAQCDIESYVYFPLLEETGYMPSSRYPMAPEIFAHAQRIAKHFDLYPDILFHTAATDATWDEDDQRWVVRTDRGDEIRTRYLVRSSGALGNPTFPAVEGIETFPGTIFHSSRWDYAYTGGSPTDPLTGLADKRVAVVGSGASAVQVVAALAGAVEHLYAIQRTPGPAVGRRDTTPTDEAWYRAQPAGWQRERIRNYDANTSGFPQPTNLVDDQFSRFFRATATCENVVDDVAAVDPRDVPLVRELADLDVMATIRGEVDAVVADPTTADLLKPWYGFGCKRVTFDDGYLAAFNREDVTLIDAPSRGLERIEGSTVTAGGQEFDVDCIVLATGFDTSTDTERRSGLTVTGRDGVTLTEHYANGLRTLHGFLSDGFPNLFETGQGQGAIALNFTSLLDLQAEHITAIIARARELGATAVEPTPQAVEAWARVVHESGEPFRAYHAQCVPSYYNGYRREGQGVMTSQVFTAGIHVFRGLLEDWRATGQWEGLTFTGRG